MSAVRTAVGLTAIILALATQIGLSFVAGLLLPLAVTLLANHLDRDGGQLGRSFVRLAALALPASERDDMLAEWLDHVLSAGEHGLAPLTRALTIALIAAPALAVGLRIGRNRSQRRRRT